MAQSPAPNTRICCVRRVLTRRTRFADPGQVPAFEGDAAFFEMEQRHKTRLGYVVLRQVEKPRHWTR
jgi:hypothetical protein